MNEESVRRKSRIMSEMITKKTTKEKKDRKRENE